MPSPISLLYEPLIARDLKAIPAAVRKFRKSHSQTELFEAITRFALLSYSPSQHGKHAVLACLSAHDIWDQIRADLDEVLAACATYAAESRQPWSEPPITDPPSLPPDQALTIEEILQAVRAADRLRAERWLAARHKDEQFAKDYVRVASSDLSDQGHKLIVATGAWRLAEVLGEKGRFATLRIAVWEWTAQAEPASIDQAGDSIPSEELLRLLIERLVLEKGSTLPFHSIALLDSAFAAAEIGGDESVLHTVQGTLELGLRAKGSDAEEQSSSPIEVRPFGVYKLARDYGQCLKAFAITRRLQRRFPNVDCEPIIAASQHNLRHGPSFEEWSFA